MRKRDHESYEHAGPSLPVTFDPAQVVQWIEQLRADVTESVGGVMLRGARTVEIGLPSEHQGSTQRPTTAAGALVGYSLVNTAAAAAVAYLRDGSDPAGTVVAVVSVPAGDSRTAWFGPGGIGYGAGLYVDLPAGVSGSVWIRGAD